jgi:hypothetical protein
MIKIMMLHIHGHLLPLAGQSGRTNRGALPGVRTMLGRHAQRRSAGVGQMT